MMRVTTIGYTNLLNENLIAYLAERGISTEGVSDREIAAFISRDTPARLRDMVLENPDLLGQTIRFEGFATGRIDGYLKGRVTRETAERDTNISVAQLDLTDRMIEKGCCRPSSTGAS
jgi:phosphate transport system permease protein